MEDTTYFARWDYAVWITLTLLPFAILYWMIPFVTQRTIGNDYSDGSVISQQLSLMFSVKNGSFPLFVPNFGSGPSAIALPMGQIFHPLPHLSSLVPGYWSGNTLNINTLFRLLYLGFTHGILFMFLRRLRIDFFFALLLSFLTVYNLRMLDHFRYATSES